MCSQKVDLIKGRTKYYPANKNINQVALIKERDDNHGMNLIQAISKAIETRDLDELCSLHDALPCMMITPDERDALLGIVNGAIELMLDR